MIKRTPGDIFPANYLDRIGKGVIAVHCVLFPGVYAPDMPPHQDYFSERNTEYIETTKEK